MSSDIDLDKLKPTKDEIQAFEKIVKILTGEKMQVKFSTFMYEDS
jgi:hypothetical protein